MDRGFFSYLSRPSAAEHAEGGVSRRPFYHWIFFTRGIDADNYPEDPHDHLREKN